MEAKKRQFKGDYSRGSIAGNVMGLALPVLLAELVNVLYSIVDRIYIGHIPGLGAAALTGVGLAFPLLTLIGAFSNLTALGGAPLCSIARGENDEEKAGAILEVAFTLILLCAAVLTTVMFVLRTPILFFMGADGMTIGCARDYFEIYVLGSVFVLISLGMNSFITLQGYPRVGMLTVLIGAVANIVLDPILIFGLKLGVRGAALATVISQALSAGWVVRFLTRGPVRLKIRRLRLEAPTALSIVHLGLSGFTFKFTNSITQALVNVTLRAYGGDMAMYYIGAMSIINSTREVIHQPISAITEGCKPVLGFNYGARLYGRVSRTIGFTTAASLSYNTLIWALVMLFPAAFAGIFSSDPLLVETCVPCMRAYFGAFVFLSLQQIGQHTFIGLNHPNYAVFFSLFRKLVLIVPFTLLLPRLGFGAIGVFYAERISQIIGGISCFTTMYFVVWRKIRALAAEQRMQYDGNQPQQ